MRLLTLFVVLAFAAAATAAAAVSARSGVAPKVYVFGDVHYDPFYGMSAAVGPCTDPSSAPAYSPSGCDTSLPLLESAMADVAAQYAQDGEGLLLLTGDVVRHNMKDFETTDADPYDKDYDLIGTITNTVMRVIQKYMNATGVSEKRARDLVVPHPSIMLTLGNDDQIPDYHFSDQMGNHPALERYAASLVNQSILTAAEAAQICKCGFFSRVIVGSQGNLRVVALNSIMYSVGHKPTEQQSIADPCGQFAWLKAELAQARANGEAVYILGHIIPFAKKWFQQYIDTYRGIVVSYNDVVRVQFFGHTHMFNFLTLNADTAPLLFDVPAISPVDGQRPSYLRVSTASYGGNQSWAVDEIHLRYLDSGSNTWSDGGQFCQTFGLSKPLTTKKLYQFGTDLAGKSDGSTTWDEFERMHFGGQIGSNSLDKKQKLKLCCDMLAWSHDEYEECKEDN